MSSLDRLASLIDWTPIEALLDDIHVAAKGERTWPPLALFKAMLIAVWYDLSDVKLAEALDDRTSFWRFCALIQAARWLPNRRIIGVGDTSFASIDLLNDVRPWVTLVRGSDVRRPAWMG
jgi:Transposase domain (DUF772)